MAESQMSASVQSERQSSFVALDQAVEDLREHAREFARISPAARARLLRQCLAVLQDVAPAWSAAGLRAKGLAADSAEEWLSGPLPVGRHLRLLASTLDQIAAVGAPLMGRGARYRDDGRLMVDLFPSSRLDSVLYRGFSGHVLMQEGVDRDLALSQQAPFYQESNPSGALALILGAGNVSSIAPMDVLTKMFNDGFVCLLKMNPVNEWVGPHLERVFGPLISAGFLRIVYGGAEVGEYLTYHHGIDSVHLTGSATTHDTIVWGAPGVDSDRRRTKNEPLLNVPITSELGNVSPVAVVPGEYSTEELAFQARNLATMVTNNVSFNCNAAKMVITARGWRQRDTFFELLGQFLTAVPTRHAYYPGAMDRYAALTRDRERVNTFGQSAPSQLPWTVIRDVDASSVDDPLFRTEPFCPIVSETSISGADPVEFLERATGFMNDTLWGTLSACLIIPDKLQRDTVVGSALERAIAQLRYGNVAVNHWTALNYGLAVFPWGAHPSSSLQDIQSGIGWVHNTYMLGGVDKAVVRGPIKMRPAPIWFSDNPKSGALGSALLDMEARPRWLKLPRLLMRAL